MNSFWRHDIWGYSLRNLPERSSIPVYIVELNRPLAVSDCAFSGEDIERWDLGAAYGSKPHFTG